MKKVFALGLLCALALTICACGETPEASDPAQTAAATEAAVTIVPAESALYSQEDIDAAVDTAMEYFEENFKGCTLVKIGYAGDDVNQRESGFLEQYGGDELIVLSSAFDVDSSGGDGSLNPNTTYTGWNWILVRDAGGQWRHADHGY